MLEAVHECSDFRAILPHSSFRPGDVEGLTFIWEKSNLKYNVLHLIERIGERRGDETI